MVHYLTGYEQFLQNISKSAHTVKQYVLDAKHFLNFWQQHEDKDFIVVQNLYRKQLIEKYSPASTNRKLAGTRKFVLFLYDRAYINSFNDTVFEPIDVDEKRLNVLSNEQIAIIRQTLHRMRTYAMDEEQLFLATRNTAMFDLFLATGIKPSEAIRMKWQHVKQYELTVLHSESYRIIQLPEALLLLLNDLKRVNETIIGNDEFVWLGLGNKRGEPITEKTVERFFAMLTKQVGFKITATICRYTFMFNSEQKELFEMTGYTRKDNMKERLNKINKQ